MNKPYNSKGRSRGRGNSGKRSQGRGQHYDGQNANRVRGNAQQLMDKYLTLARDANSNGDRVLAENYLQHSDHYFRVINARQEAALASGAKQKDKNSGNNGNSSALDGPTQSKVAEPAPTPTPTPPPTPTPTPPPTPTPTSALTEVLAGGDGGITDALLGEVEDEVAEKNVVEGDLPVAKATRARKIDVRKKMGDEDESKKPVRSNQSARGKLEKQDGEGATLEEDKEGSSKGTSSLKSLSKADDAIPANQ